MDKTRASLLSAVKDPANQRAWAEFYDIYKGFISNLVRKSSVYLRPDEADEVVQDVFVQIFKGKVKYDRSKGKFRSLLTVLVNRRCIDRMRQRRAEYEKAIHRGEGDDRDTHTIDRIEVPTKSALAKIADEEWEQLVKTRARQRLKSEVPAKQYQIFEAAFLRDIPPAKVATTLGVNSNQINLARSRVGTIYEQLLSKAAKELSAPRLPKPCRDAV